MSGHRQPCNTPASAGSFLGWAGHAAHREAMAGPAFEEVGACVSRVGCGIHTGSQPARGTAVMVYRAATNTELASTEPSLGGDKA